MLWGKRIVNRNDHAPELSGKRAVLRIRESQRAQHEATPVKM